MCAQGLNYLELCSGETDVQRLPNCSKQSHGVHLFFADYSLIFFRATVQDCLKIKKCLQRYEKALGQAVNYEKSFITFCPSSTSDLIDSITNILGIPIVRGHELYLGLPTFSFRSKRIQFALLRDKIFKRINGWASKLLSAGGKEALIKAVLQAVPSYAMSCFKMLFNLCKEMKQLCAKFWWKSSETKGGMHWASWAKLCKPK
ncbi:uncharacterized protein [Henckelia pumila]|uniref:uncharacterized protein n=1 Tax=Henckelia pumila TaxID=405737 RepID=UPI003C6E9938